MSATPASLRPLYENIRAHYDVSNDFYRLFLDPSLTYSCARFTRPEMMLEEGQIAKIDSCLAKAGVLPGHKVLEIGFGWGSTLRRAAEQFGAHAIGLTLSQAQYDYVDAELSRRPETRGSIALRVQGWEEFDEPVDRIVSIEVFEHFPRERYSPFFQKCRRLLPPDGRLVLQTSLTYYGEPQVLAQRGIELTHEDIVFAKFVRDVIFPGGYLCSPQLLLRYAEAEGWRCVDQESLADHYPRTLDEWIANLQARRAEAIALTDEKTYDNYVRYMSGCARNFRLGHIDVMQFTLVPA